MSYVVFDRFGEDYDVVDDHQAVAVEKISQILNLQETIYNVITLLLTLQ